MYSKFLIKHFGELTSPWVHQTVTWLTASWFVDRRVVLLTLWSAICVRHLGSGAEVYVHCSIK